jgi:dsRNA-specific ribonuclease
MSVDLQMQIEQMSLEEKLSAMEALWAALCRHQDVLPVPQWHKDILDEREALIEKGQAHFSDWESAKKRIIKETSEECED